MEEEYQSNTTPPTPFPLGDLAQGLLSNPEMLQKIGGILKAISPTPVEAGTDAHPSSGAAEGSVQAETVPASSISTDGLASLLSNPEILEKLPSVLAAMKPMLSSISPPPPQKEEGHRSASDCRNDLLLSLKPFLSSQRQDAVDAILRIAKLGVLLGQIK